MHTLACLLVVSHQEYSVSPQIPSLHTGPSSTDASSLHWICRQRNFSSHRLGAFFTCTVENLRCYSTNASLYSHSCHESYYLLRSRICTPELLWLEIHFHLAFVDPYIPLSATVTSLPAACLKTDVNHTSKPRSIKFNRTD